MNLSTLSIIVSIATAAISCVGIICTVAMAYYVVKQQTRSIRREARAEALKEFSSSIGVWMHRPTKETWIKMANEFWRARLWLNPKQATDISQFIDSYKSIEGPALSEKEYGTGLAMFKLLTEDIV